MSAKSENEFPTISDVRDAMSQLVEQGFGDLPAQIVIVPDSTMQAIARVKMGAGYNPKKPALMIDLIPSVPNGRMPVGVITADQHSGHSMKSAQMQ